MGKQWQLERLDYLYATAGDTNKRTSCGRCDTIQTRPLQIRLAHIYTHKALPCTFLWTHASKIPCFDHSFQCHSFHFGHSLHKPLSTWSKPAEQTCPNSMKRTDAWTNASTSKSAFVMIDWLENTSSNVGKHPNKHQSLSAKPWTHLLTERAVTTVRTTPHGNDIPTKVAHYFFHQPVCWKIPITIFSTNQPAEKFLSMTACVTIRNAHTIQRLLEYELANETAK